MIELGDTVRDKLTGFKGIAVAKYIYLTGCARFSVQPKVIKNVLPKSATFDELELEVITPKKQKKRKYIGGPALYHDEQRR